MDLAHPTLQIASFQSFECHSCGRCCRNSWAIRVESGARDEIWATSVADEVVKAGYQPLLVLEDQAVVTGRKADGACVFLAPDNLCGIHAEIGKKKKPLACQVYPYGLTETPDGYFASLSFACPSVVAGLGQDLEANRRELQELLDDHGQAMSRPDSLPHQVEILQGRSIPWKEYLALETAISSAFQPEDPVVSLLSIATDLVLTVVTHQGDLPLDWSSIRGGPREGDFEEAVLAMFSASVVALLENPDEPESRQPFSEAMLSGQQLFSERHQVALPEFSLGQPQPEWVVAVFQRYFQNAIFGKSLLTTSVVSRLLCLACAYTLVMYYGEAFKGSETDLSLEALTKAFELVESELVVHTRSVDELFLTFETTLVSAYACPP